MKPKIIRNEADYEDALDRMESIMHDDPAPETEYGRELEVLAVLVEKYENERYPMGLPTPVEAIKFQMEQRGLRRRDLIPLLGSAARVSEVLSGKRTLSISMIRNLVKVLGIPAEILLQEAGADLPSARVLEQGQKFPIAELVKRGWFPGFSGTVAEAKAQLEELLNRFVEPLGPEAMLPVLNRQHIRNGSTQDEDALNAWRIRIATEAMRYPIGHYHQGSVGGDFLRELAKLSVLDAGPLLAREFLNKSGIHLICERHLPKTHLDGAAMILPDGHPVIGLSLRHDRLDHFWFTLFHELSHVALHLDGPDSKIFFDDLTESPKDKCEQDADNLAADSLIPGNIWKLARLRQNSPIQAVIRFAEENRIHPCIPAGRIRHETGNFKVFASLLGRGKVRAMFCK